MTNVNRTAIDSTLFELLQRINHKVCDMSIAEKKLEPLAWFIYTQREPQGFLQIFVNCSSRQLSTIAARLIKAGSTNEAINSVCIYLGFSH